MSEPSSAPTDTTSKTQQTQQPAGSRPALDYSDPRVRKLITSYWRKNIAVMIILLACWAFVGLGCGILWADWLNQYKLGGFPLGFWFAQQGSIICFILIILVYCLVMNRLDKTHHDELEVLRREQVEQRRG